MKTIRHFGREIDPSVYRRGFGFSGFLVFWLNRLRAWLENWINLTIVRLEARASGASEEEIDQFIQSLRRKPGGTAVIKDEKGLVRRLLREADGPQLEQREGRYMAPRKNSDTPERPLPVGDGPLASTLARAEKRRDRSLRYHGGREVKFTQEDNIIPIRGSNDGREEARRANDSDSRTWGQPVGGNAPDSGGAKTPHDAS